MTVVVQPRKIGGALMEATPENAGYPFVPELHEGWEPTELFAICGWFEDTRFGDHVLQAHTFAGFIKQFPDGTILGNTIDTYGGACHEGVLKRNELITCVKHYHLPQFNAYHGEIRWQARPTSDGYWEGEWQILSTHPPASGKIKLRIIPIHDNAYALPVVTGPRQVAPAVVLQKPASGRPLVDPRELSFSLLGEK